MQQKINILLVEDNKSDQRIISSLLEEAGFRYNLLKADTLIDGIEFIINNTIDVILLDLGLPDSVGYKTLQKIIEKNNLIPVIVLTGTQNSIVESLAIKAGAQEYLTKDKLTNALLFKTIQNAILRNNLLKKQVSTIEELSTKVRNQAEALSIADIAYWSMDLVNYQMKWSREIYQIFNFQNDSLIPTLSLYMDYVHNEDKEMVSVLFNCLSTAVSKKQLTHRLVVGNNIITVKLNARFSFEDNTKPLKIVGTIQHSYGEYEAIKQEDKIDLGTNQIIKEFIQSVVFDIKTPINSVKHFGYIIGQSRLDENQKELFEQLQSSVDELSNTAHRLNGMLILTDKKSHKNTSILPLKSLLKTAEQYLSLEIPEKNVKTEMLMNSQIEYNPDLFTILLQTIKAMVTLPDSKIPKRIKSNFKQSQNNFRLSLIIDLKDFSKSLVQELDVALKSPTHISLVTLINERFHSIADMLSIIQSALQQMNGSISLTKSQASPTLEMNINFKSVQESANNSSKENLNLDNLKVLLVDDHFLNRLSTKKTLQNQFKNFVFFEAENGWIALNASKKEKFDIILMDLQMPVMDGIESTKEIKKLYNPIIIGMSAGEIPNQEKILADAGFTDFIIKPFKPEDLIEKIIKHSTRLLSYSV